MENHVSIKGAVNDKGPRWRVLEFITKSPDGATRLEIARATGFTRHAVSNHLFYLKKQKLVKPGSRKNTWTRDQRTQALEEKIKTFKRKQILSQDERLFSNYYELEKKAKERLVEMERDKENLEQKIENIKKLFPSLLE